MSPDEALELAARLIDEVERDMLACEDPHRNRPLIAHSIGVRSSESSDWTR